MCAVNVTDYPINSILQAPYSHKWGFADTCGTFFRFFLLMKKKYIKIPKFLFQNKKKSCSFTGEHSETFVIAFSDLMHGIH